MGDLTAHFSAREFRCRHCGQLPTRSQLLHLATALERLRAAVGRPLRVVSAYRCQEHNRAVGGARRSRHLVGDAADLEPGYATVDVARRAGFRGIGATGPWATHVDLRPRPARWTYDR